MVGPDGQPCTLREWPEKPTAAQVIYWRLHQERLCPGIEQCEYFVDGHLERCPECVIPDFEYCVSRTALGQRVMAAWELDDALECNMTVPYLDMTCREATLVKIIRQEKLRARAISQEESNRARDEAMMARIDGRGRR